MLRSVNRSFCFVTVLFGSVVCSSGSDPAPVTTSGWRTASVEEPATEPADAPRAEAIAGATIERPADARRILGAPKARSRTGQPLKINRDLREALANVHTDPGDVPQLKVDVEGEKLDLPLEHTHVDAHVTGHVVRVEVTQTYKNPFTYPIEAIYVFPLPENAAVDDMKMVIGERVIESDIQKREEARRTYEDAKRAGHTAALLEQERPNIFTQSVANIEPGTDIDVVIRYAQHLTYDGGEYEFVFPMVVGPRFIPGEPGGRSGTGWAKDTSEVPDASRITPYLVGGGQRTGHDISIEVTVDAGLPVKSWNVPTHDVEERGANNGNALSLELAKHDSIPNRDFILKWAVDGKQPQATLLTHRKKPGDDGGTFTLIVQPPELDVDELVGQREVIFVVDVSGSMHGTPLSMCKDAMREAIRGLRPVDTFNVITFAGRTGQAFERPRPANDTHIKDAFAYVDGLSAGGGTMMGLGVEAALKPAIEQGRHRYVFFLTDGYVGNESTIIGGARDLVKAQERRGQRARVFSFGVGSSTNRHLLEGIADAGKGVAVYASTREDPTIAVNTFYRYIDHPILSDVQIDWHDLEVSDVMPTLVPDLFASRPLVFQGRFEGHGKTRVTVSGRVGGKLLELPIEVGIPDEDDNAVIATLWARAKIESLEQSLAYREGVASDIVGDITNLGLEYRLVTRYTSFVAVDRSKKVNGESRTIVQPVETPEGVNAEMAGAGMVRGMAASSAMGAPTASPPAMRRRPMKRRSSPSSPAVRMEMDERKREAPAIQVQGSLNANTVETIIKGRLLEIRKILAGKHARVRFVIGADGSVTRVEFLGSALDAKQRKRLERAIKQWHFPAPSDGKRATVTYRF